MLRILQNIFLLCLFFIVGSRSVSAINNFYDDFNDYNQYWSYQDNNGDIAFSDGKLNLSSTYWNFPFIKTVDTVEMRSDGKISVKFKYNKIGRMGDGIGFGFSRNGNYYYQLGIWGDGRSGIYVFYNDFSTPEQGSCANFSIAK